MMSKKNKRPQDYIPNPCKESWDEMTGDEQRRHCHHCETHVHNLDGMSDAEIMKLREENGGKLCGAFRLGPRIAKPLALGSGIASLALASCAKPEPPLVGMLPPVSYNGKGDDDQEAEVKKPEYATPPRQTRMIVGKIRIPPRNSDGSH